MLSHFCSCSKDHIDHSLWKTWVEWVQSNFDSPSLSTNIFCVKMKRMFRVITKSRKLRIMKIRKRSHTSFEESVHQNVCCSWRQFTRFAHYRIPRGNSWSDLETKLKWVRIDTGEGLGLSECKILLIIMMSEEAEDDWRDRWEDSMGK